MRDFIKGLKIGAGIIVPILLLTVFSGGVYALILSPQQPVEEYVYAPNNEFTWFESLPSYEILASDISGVNIATISRGPIVVDETNPRNPITKNGVRIRFTSAPTTLILSRLDLRFRYMNLERK